MSKIKNFLFSAFTWEWLLTYHWTPNGGGVIFLRSLLIAVECLLLIALFQYFIFDGYFRFSSTYTKAIFEEDIKQFSAIFVFTYLALYARFAAQWRYLADLYNKIKETEVKDGKESKPILEWKAGFIEDADELHLATKKIFMSVIYHWFQDERIREEFRKNTPGGLNHLYHLKNRVDKAYDEHNTRLSRRFRLSFCDMKIK